MGSRSFHRRGVALLVAASTVVAAGHAADALERPRYQTVLNGVGAVAGLDGSQGIVVSPDDKHVYVTGSFDDAIARFNRNASTGKLTFGNAIFDTDAGINGLEGARGVDVSPDGKHVYVASLADAAITTFSRNATTGVLTFVETDLDNAGGGPELLGAHGVTVSPDGKHVYVASRSADSITTFKRHSVSGSLTFVETDVQGVGGVTGLDAAEGVTVSPDGKFVYVASEGQQLVANDGAVAVFKRHPLTGALTFVEAKFQGGAIDGLEGVNSLVVSPDGKHVYASGEFDDGTLGDDDLGAIFTRNLVTGKLTFVAAIPPFVDTTGDLDCIGVSGGGGIAINGAGDRVFVTESWHSALLVFTRNAVTGALTRISAQCEFGSGQRNPDAIAVSSDGATVYTTGLDGNVTVFGPNRPPVVSAPLADVTVDADAADTVIALGGVFKDPDLKDTMTYSVVATNPSLLTATTPGATLRLRYKAGQHGSATVTVTATDAEGRSVSDVITVTVRKPTVPLLRSVEPARLYESRVGPDYKTHDGKFRGTGPTAANGVAEIKVTGRGGVATNASAVFLNVVAVNPTSSGYLTVFPCGTKPPLAANVNYNGNDIAANAVLAKIGTGGRVCIFTLAKTDLVVDVNGYVPTSGSPNPVEPARLYESRVGPDYKTHDGKFRGTGPTAANGVAEIKVTGRGGVATNASAVFLNVVAVNPTSSGYLTVFPCGTKPPLAANVNYNGNDIAANAVLAKIGTGGRVCIFTLAKTDLVVDVNGYVPTSGSPNPVEPARLYESRVGPDYKTHDGKFRGTGPTAANGVAEIKVTGRGGVATNASAVFLNVVAVNPTSSGYLTVFPCGTKPPLAANVNYNGNDIAANAVLAKIGTGGRVCIFTLAKTDLVVDVNGYVPSS